MSFVVFVFTSEMESDTNAQNIARYGLFTSKSVLYRTCLGIRAFSIQSQTIVWGQALQRAIGGHYGVYIWNNLRFLRTDIKRIYTTEHHYKNIRLLWRHKHDKQPCIRDP